MKFVIKGQCIAIWKNVTIYFHKENMENKLHVVKRSHADVLRGSSHVPAPRVTNPQERLRGRRYRKVPYDKHLTSGFDKETRWKVSEMVIVLCINRNPSLSRNEKKNSLLMFHYKIIHQIIFTNTDFEQNEKKSLSSFVPVSLFWKTNWDGGTGRLQCSHFQ